MTDSYSLDRNIQQLHPDEIYTICRHSHIYQLYLKRLNTPLIWILRVHCDFLRSSESCARKKDVVLLGVDLGF
jgi:hypothetical protein